MRNLAAITALVCATGIALAADSTNKDAGLGINLTGLSYWSTQWTLLDVMKQASNGSGQLWATTNAHTYQFNTADQALLDLDENGWPRSLPQENDAPFHYATTVIFQDNAHYPAGDYVVLYEGEGELAYIGPERINTAPGRDIVRLDEGGFFHLQIRRTDPQATGNYLRNIRVIVPGGSCSEALDDFAASAEQCATPADFIAFEQSYSQRLFHPLFIRDIAPFRTLRFMQFLNTINHPAGAWAERPELSDASWALDKGAPIELTIQMANSIKAEPWLNIPVRADMQYVREFARLIKSELSEDLQLYIELGNEIWNHAWPYNQDGEYLTEQARQYWPTATQDDFTLRLNYYAMQSAKVCTEVKQVFAEQQHRVHCVLNGQGDVHWVNEQILSCPLFAATTEGSPCYQAMDAFAVGSYFAGYFADDKYLNLLDTWSQNSNGLDNLFTEMQQGLLWSLTFNPDEPAWWQAPEHGALNAAEQSMTNTLAQLAPYGLPLLAYEGGQHLTYAGNVSGPRDQIQHQLFLPANRDPRMADALSRHLDTWRLSGAGLFVLFESTGKWDRWGAFPLKEYQTQPQQQAVKFDAVLAYMQQHDCWWPQCERQLSSEEPTPVPPIPEDPVTPPSELTLTTSSLTDTMGVALHWHATDTVQARYQIWRDAQLIAETQTAGYQDHWLNLRQPYVYQIQQLDAQGQVLAESAPVTAFAGDSEPPGAALDLSIRSDGQWGYQLNWTPATDNVAVTQYKIYRNQQPYSLSVNSAFHDPWPPTGEVSYQVQALDGAGNVSTLSAPVTVINN